MSTPQRPASIPALLVLGPAVAVVLALFAMASSNDLSRLTTTDPTADETGEEPDTAADPADSGALAPETTVTPQPGQAPPVEPPPPHDAEDATPAPEDATGTSEAAPATPDQATPDQAAPDQATTAPAAEQPEVEQPPAGPGAEPVPGTDAPTTTVAPTTTAPEETTTTRADDDPEDTDESGSGGLTRFLWPLLLAAAGLAVAYLIGSLIRSVVGRRAETEPDVPQPAPDVRVADPVSALDRIRAELENEPDPRQAIRQAYALVESGFGQPDLARGHAETPARYLERTLGLIDGGEQALGRLTDHFMIARYSTHAVTEDMRTDAIESVLGLRSLYQQREQLRHREPVAA